jgi:DNA-binding response OmpR family regulator
MVVDRKRVIFIEDDADLLEAVGSSLREQFAVWVGRSGEQGLEIADELGFDADVLLVDLALGDGMRGDQFVQEYRRRAKRDVPVVILSGAPRAYEIAQSLRVSAVLPKPTELDEIIGTLRLFARPGEARHGGGATDIAAGG